MRDKIVTVSMQDKSEKHFIILDKCLMPLLTQYPDGSIGGLKQSIMVRDAYICQEVTINEVVGDNIDLSTLKIDTLYEIQKDLHQIAPEAFVSILAENLGDLKKKLMDSRRKNILAVS